MNLETIPCTRCGRLLYRTKRALLAPQARALAPVVCARCATPTEAYEIIRAIGAEKAGVKP